MVKYKPSQVNILVHVGRPTSISSIPSEIGTVDAPVDEGAIIPIEATLTDNQANPIANKQLHFYDPLSAQIDVKATDDLGTVLFNYTADASHDGQDISIKYLGD